MSSYIDSQGKQRQVKGARRADSGQGRPRPADSAQEGCSPNTRAFTEPSTRRGCGVGGGHGAVPVRGAATRYMPPASGARWVEARERGVARLAMWRALWPACGRDARCSPGVWPPVSDVPGSAGLWPAPGRRPAKRRQERHARAGQLPRPRRTMPSRSACLGALPRTGAGEARERGRRPLGHAGGPAARLRAGRPRSQGVAPGSDVPGSAGILPATGRRPAKRRQERDPRGGHTPPPEGWSCPVMGSPESAGHPRPSRRHVTRGGWSLGDGVSRERRTSPACASRRHVRTPELPWGPRVMSERVAACPTVAEGPQSPLAERDARAPEGCCFPLYFVGSPRELLGLFRRRIAWDDGAIRDTWARGEVVELDWVDRWGRSSPVWGER